MIMRRYLRRARGVILTAASLSFVTACAGSLDGNRGGPLCARAGENIHATMIRQLRGTAIAPDPFASARRPGFTPPLPLTQPRFVQPVQFASSIGEAFVADPGRAGILRVNLATEAVSKFAELPPTRIGGLFVDRWQSVYVAEPARRRVVRYGRDGVVDRMFQDTRALAEPIDVVADETDRIYVADAVTARIVVFNLAGEVIDVLGGRAGSRWPFAGIVALAGGPLGLYGVDSTTGRVHVVTRSGEPQFSLGAGRLRLPVAVAVDRFGRVFVADQYENRVHVFEPDTPGGTAGHVLDGIAPAGRLTDLWIDDVDVLYVVDAASALVTAYKVSARCQS